MSRGRWAVVDEPVFRRDWDAGIPLNEMGALHGIAASTVSVVARRLRLPQRTAHQNSGRTHSKDFSPTVLQGGQWVSDARGVMRWQASA